MKLVLFVVFIITIFPADSRDFGVDQDEHSSMQLMGIDSMKERKVDKEQKLRGKSDKKHLKALVKKIGSLDKKLTQANSEVKKSLDSLKDGNTKLTKENSEMKIENQAIKKSLDSLKDGNSKLTQAYSDMNTQLQAIKKQQGYLTFSNGEKVSWDVAAARCKSFGARLAVLTNPKGFHAFALNRNLRAQGGVWLGATDRSRNGTWTWTNGEPFRSFPWGPNEPTRGEYCLEWYHNNNYNNEGCHSLRGYACEHGYN